jgi:hypothetical protein
VELVDVLLRLRDSGQRQHLRRDSPVGPARHRSRFRHRPPEHLIERHPVQFPADAVRVDQRVVDIPQDE